MADQQPNRWRCWRVLGPEHGHYCGVRVDHDVYVNALTEDEAKTRAAVLLGCQPYDVRGAEEE